MPKSVCIVGAGAVGLAIANELAGHGHEVFLIERLGGVGRETSSRNSGVIHAGIYYPRDSWKSKLCLRGKELLYAWCDAHDVPHERCGKLVIATDEAEQDKLRALVAHARSVGVLGLATLDAAEIQAREPELRGVEALWSETSGLVDPHAFMDSVAASARERGVSMAFQTSLAAAGPREGKWLVQTTDEMGRESELLVDWLVNAAGFGAPEVAKMAGVDVASEGWELRPCKGSYFSLGSNAPQPNAKLVYPLPVEAGLGIHLTRDLGGRLRAGPDTEYIDTIEYSVDPSRADAFCEAVKRYMPGLRVDHLAPDYAGIRPKLSGPGEPKHDFVVATREHDAARAVHMVGIESPGLTAALAIGEHVANLVNG